MKIANSFKKAAAAALSAAVVAATIPFAGIVVSAQTGFDENSISLRFGVVSDLHLSYSSDSLATIKNKIQNYTDTVAALDNIAGGELDAILLGGDYTGTGGAVQGETFVSASAAIMDAINAGKAEADKTKFIMTYGNHDTEWGGQMSYAQWEAMLSEYGLLDDVTAGPENSGCYSATTVKNGKTYYYFSVETENYNAPSNTFRKDVLAWLDSGLAAASADNDAYIYVVSHGPIKESGVYGSDTAFDKNADWGTAEAGFTGSVTRDGATYETSSDIDGVLKKYPQVVYFSGHTHFTDELESSIMSEDYTAVNVASINSGDWFSNISNYVDGQNHQIGNKAGYALLVEVDANGNQRIRRIQNAFNLTDSAITYAEELEGVANSSSAAGEPATINGVVVGSIALGEVSAEVAELEPWVMAAPAADNSHLVKYSKAARMATPVFASDASVTVANIYNGTSEFMADIAFSAATCSNTIIRYELTLVNDKGEDVSTRWALGNWTDTAAGVAEGSSHRDATAFDYNQVTFNSAAAKKGYAIKVTAVDEFGGSASITSAPFAEAPIATLEKPADRPVYEELFNTTPDRVVVSANQGNATYTLDENGKLVTTVDSSAGFRNVLFMNSKSKYDALVTDTETNSPFNGWAYPGVHPENLTDLSADDTFVYEADFSTTEGNGNIFWHLRTPDMKFGSGEGYIAEWQTDYTGIILNNNGVYIAMCNQSKWLSSAFKFDDTDTHHITVVSSPKLISIWIDDITICENYAFNPETWADTSIAGCFKSDKMTPTLAIHALADDGGRQFTVSNQSLYYYYPSDEAALYTAVDSLKDSNNIFENIPAERVYLRGGNADATISSTADAGVLTTTVGGTGTRIVGFVPSVERGKTYNTMSGVLGGWSSAAYENAYKGHNLSADDTFIYEADFMNTDENLGGQINFHVRAADWATTNDWTTLHSGVLVQNGGVYLRIKREKHLKESFAFSLNDNEMHHIVIKSTPTTISVTIDGIAIFTDEPYSVQAAIDKGLITAADVKSEVMMPTNTMFLDGTAGLVITNQDMRVCPEVTAYKNTENLVTSDVGQLSSGFTHVSGSYTIGNSFYSDTRYTNLSSGKWTQDRLSLFGPSNQLFVPDNKASYVLSGLATATNASLKEESTGNTYPSRMTTYLGKYNGEDAFAFIQNTDFAFYVGSENYASIKLADYGYEVGDTVRVTVLLTPFGFEYYFDGVKLMEHTYENPNLIDYSALSLGIGGTLGAWRDIVMYENTDNADVYVAELTRRANKILNSKGIAFTDSDRVAANEIIAAAAAASGTDNAALKAYAGVTDAIYYAAKVGNNLVADGSAAVTPDFERTFDILGGTFTHYGVQLYANGSCPIAINDSWAVDFDLSITRVGASNVRLIFAPFSSSSNVALSKGAIMIQDSSVFELTNETGTNIGYNGIGGAGINIAKSGTSLHLRYEISPVADDGKTNVRIIATSIDGATTYCDYTVTYSGAAITEINPYIYYRTADISIDNLCIAVDLTKDLAMLSSVAIKADTTDKALVSVNNYNAAYSLVTEILANSELYGRSEINAAADTLSEAKASLAKYGDITLDGETNIKDLIRFKKYFAGLGEVENVTADVDADGDILGNDLVLIRKCLLGIK